MTRRFAVVGGGITGLAAAHALLTTAPGAHVTVFEADDRVGGKVRTSPFAGLAAVDEAADAFLARLPWATGLAHAVGLADELVAPSAPGAAMWWEGLHRIPDGLLLGLPTDLGRLARTQLLTRRGRARAALEPLLPRTSIDHDSLGRFVRRRFGDEVHERLVDPLVGSIYAADTDRFSLRAVPQIADLAATTRSVLLGARRRPTAPTATPVFLTPRRGVGALVDAVAAAVAAAGGVVRTAAQVVALAPAGTSWRMTLRTAAGDHDEVVDGIVLACPASTTATLLRETVSVDPVAALSGITTADVAIVTIAVDAATWPGRLRGLSGYLVPKARQRHVTAVSFGSQKWSQWDNGVDVVLRISLGHDGHRVLHMSDDELITAALDEVGRHLDHTLAPSHVRLTRWPGAFPQYRPHHADRIAEAERSLPSGLALAGASFHGIGIPACVRSAQRAAAVLVTPTTAVAH